MKERITILKTLLLSILTLSLILLSSCARDFDEKEELSLGGIANFRQEFEDAGIIVEIESLHILGNYIDIEFLITDTIGGQLNEDSQLNYSMILHSEPWPLLGQPNIPSGQGVLVDDNSLRIQSRTLFDSPIEDGTLEITMHFIVSHYITEQHQIDFDFSEIEVKTPYGFIGGIPILPPHTLDIEVTSSALDNARGHRISSIGLIDYRLHIQEVRDALPAGGFIASSFSAIRVLDSDDEYLIPITVDDMSVVTFTISEDGALTTQFEFGQYGLISDEYSESIFAFRSGYLSEYSIIAEKWSVNWKMLDWSINVNVSDFF
jgi:hypothetical protein